MQPDSTTQPRKRGRLPFPPNSLEREMRCAHRCPHRQKHKPRTVGVQECTSTTKTHCVVHSRNSCAAVGSGSLGTDPAMVYPGDA